MLDNNSDIQTINICHMGFDVRVEVSPRWHVGHLMHFALHGDIVSETGYRSHFVQRDEYLRDFNDTIESLKSACQIILESLVKDHLKSNPKLISQITQLNLF